MIHPIAQLIDKIASVSEESANYLSGFILLQTIRMNKGEISKEEADKEIRDFINNIIEKTRDSPEMEEARKEFDESIEDFREAQRLGRKNRRLQ